LRVADPNFDNGAFSSLTTGEAMSWIMSLGHINEIDPRFKYMFSRNPKRQHEIATENLRAALWDVQRLPTFYMISASRINRTHRLDYLFPEHLYSKTPDFDIGRLESWPLWKIPHFDVRNPALWNQNENAPGKWARLNS
jgi:hypothetical protein